jgi:chromosomal replication initiation ATPase DnaA
VIEAAVALACTRFDVEPRRVMNGSRIPEAAVARQVAMAVLAVVTDLGVEAIGTAFRRSGAMVTHARRRARENPIMREATRASVAWLRAAKPREPCK